MDDQPTESTTGQQESPAFIPQELYIQILEAMPIPCVDVAIVAQGAVLLVRRKDAPASGEWWVPGGRVLKGEMMRLTARRKAREEVGLDCHVGPIIHTAETIFPDGPHGIPVHSINSCFFLYPVDPEFTPTLDDRHHDYRWVNCIPENLHPYVQRCLLAAGLDLTPSPSPPTWRGELETGSGCLSPPLYVVERGPGGEVTPGVQPGY